MERRFFEEIVGQEVLLASGDASQPAGGLQVTESVLGLAGTSIMEETSDYDESSAYDEVSSVDSTEQPLSLCPVNRLSYPPPPCNALEEQPTFKFGTVLPSHQRVNYIKTNYMYPSGAKYKAVSSATKKQSSIELQRSRSNSCVDNRPTLCLDEICQLLTCEMCRVVPMTSLTVHCCPSGHQACGHCFSTGYRTCMECKKPLEGRNEVLEKVLQRLRQVCPGLFPPVGPIELNSNLDEAEKLKHSSMLKKNIVQHSTHRPMDCPHLYCHRVIAANGFLAHFQFEHSSVPVFEMSPDCAHQFGLSPRCFAHRYPRAIAIIEVNLIAQRCSPKRKKKATFHMRRDAVICVLLGAALKFQKSIFLMAWCACFHEEETPLTYCLRATSTSGSETCYNGPTSSLHNSQEPANIMKEAQCLVLSSGVFGQSKDRSRSKESITFDLQFNFK